MPKGRLTIAKPRIPVTKTGPFANAPTKKRTDSIYGTAAHRHWRAQVIQRARGRCEGKQHQGPNPPEGRLYADHIIELKDGGAPFDVTNGQALCHSCHEAKGAAERAKRLLR